MTASSGLYWRRNGRAGSLLLCKIGKPPVNLKRLTNLRTRFRRGVLNDFRFEMARLIAVDHLALAGIRDGGGDSDLAPFGIGKPRSCGKGGSLGRIFVLRVVGHEISLIRLVHGDGAPKIALTQRHGAAVRRLGDASFARPLDRRSRLSRPRILRRKYSSLYADPAPGWQRKRQAVRAPTSGTTAKG